MGLWGLRLWEIWSSQVFSHWMWNIWMKCLQVQVVEFNQKVLVHFYQRSMFSMLFSIWMEFLWLHILKWFKILYNEDLQFHFTLLSWSLNWRNSLNGVLCSSLCIYGLLPNNTTSISIWIKFNKKHNLLLILLGSLVRILVPKMCIFCLLI
jgi:hypothetical protein